MADMGICARGCGAGEDGNEVELNEAGVCAECAAEETGDGMGKLDMAGGMGDEDE